MKKTWKGKYFLYRMNECLLLGKLLLINKSQAAINQYLLLFNNNIDNIKKGDTKNFIKDKIL